MSTKAEKIEAQALASKQSGQPWSTHLIGPVELEHLMNTAKKATDMSDKPKGRRMGRFRIKATHHIFDEWQSILPIMAHMVVIRCEHMAWDYSLEYTAFSDLFDELEPGIEPPWYDIKLYKEGDDVRVEAIRA